MVRPTDARPAELDQFVEDWTDGMLGSAALTDAERGAVTDAVRRCYAQAGLPWPGRVRWAPSPLAGRLLAARLARRHTPVATRIRGLTTLIWNGAGTTIGSMLAFGGSAALYCLVMLYWLRFALPGSPWSSFDPDPAYAPEHWRALWIGGVAGALLLVPFLAWMVTLEDRPSIIIGVGSGVALAALGPGPLLMMVGSWAALGVSSLTGGSSPPSPAWVTTLLTATMTPAVALAAVAGIVISWCTDPPEPLRYPDPAQDRLSLRLDAALTAAGAAAPTIPGPQARVRNAVDDSVSGVDRSIDTAVEWAVRTGRRWVRRYPVERFGGQRGGSLAGAAWLVASGAPVPPDAGSFVHDFTAASRAGWWWPHTRFVVIAERPSALRLERFRLHAEQPPDGARRLHRTDGPAAEWPDGYRVYAVHGIGVPAGLVENGGDVRALHRHPNSEVRRAAIDLIGWADYVHRAGWRLVATAPDPGNPPHELALYEDPRRRLRDVRVLMMTNGSPDRSGALRRHAETVPDTIDDPVAAAAWQYGCPVDVYRQLGRRT